MRHGRHSKTGLRDHIMSAAEYASSKILPRFQNLRTNVNISVTLQDSSLEKLEKLSSFSYLPSTNFQIETAATTFLCGYLIMKKRRQSMDVIIACHIYKIQIRKRKSRYWN
jgi:hypothetical protein